VSGPEESALDLVRTFTTIEPRLDKIKTDVGGGAGRASKTLVVRQEFWSGWQILIVSSGWLGLEATTTPAVSEKLPTRITAAIIELRARSSNFENDCLIARCYL